MAGASEEGVAVEENAAGPAQEPRRRGLSGSMSLRTRKLGRRLSRSMSIVALKLPEKAQSITRSSSKLIRSGSRDKKNRSFELSLILPDKTQRQVTVWGGSTVAEVVCETLHEVGLALAGTPTGPLSAPLALPLSEPLPPPTMATAPPTALLFLGGSKAPVEPRASAMSLEGEVLVVEHEPPQWDGKDLEVFLAWEKIYASTLFSALELYGKPLLRAAVITKEEYHLLFYYLESVSEASDALTQRMRKYIDSGLLKNKEESDSEEKPLEIKDTDDDQSKSILNELLQEGILSQQDIDLSCAITASECNEESGTHKLEDDNRSSTSSLCSSLRKVIVDIPLDNCEPTVENSTVESNDNITTVTIRTGGQCCADHRISADITENVWSNVRWDFLNPTDFGYDQVPNVKRSRSESAITPVVSRRNEEIYETLRDDEGESCGSITPYESIEDLYDCIKNTVYNNLAAEESSPSTECHSEPQYPDFYEKSSATRQSSASSEKSGTSSAFPFSKCGSSNSTGAYTSCESTSGVSSFIPKNIPEVLKCRELPPPPAENELNESNILLRQLFLGELLDAYGEYLSTYPYARALLRRKTRRDEHFAALADIRRGAAKYSIGDYLELPIERLAQYERLVGGGCARRRAARLSDLERVQDLFPHDYLALHDADAPAALASHHAQKSKSLRKRPSLDIGGIGGGNSNSLSPRTFIMEAPVQLCPLGSTSPPLDRHLFLFSDLLLVGKARGTNCFKLKESVRLAELWLSLPETDDTGFLIGWPTASGVTNYLATYPTQAARDTWHRKIQSALNVQLASEPKSTNVQIFYKDLTSSIEFCKTVSISPEMNARCVVRQALHVLQNGGEGEGEHEQEGESDEGRWGAAADFTLCVRAGRDAAPAPLQGIERPHAVQMSRIRQTLSNEDGFDLEHVNAKNNPCGLVFELRKKNQGLKSTNATPGRGLRLLRRGGRLFGVALTRLCNGTPPPALLHALRRLRVAAPLTHGVFRRSANAKALRLLRDKLDTLGPWAEGCAELERAPVLLLAALVKEFFRALPQPLLAADLYPSWLQVLSLPPAEKVAAVRSLLLKLPKSHYNMLTYFVCLLQAIAKKSNINLMCPMNLGVCVGPSLLWPNVPCDKAPKAVPMVVELLIVKAEALFGPQIAGLLGSGSPESSNALLDSGAEESDSLHSVGISLDSMELSTPRKEKLSLSRDSGLTLSEDDSNSNGGNSPAPRNILHSLSAPTCNLQDQKLLPRYGADNHNVNGLPQVNQRQQNIYSNKAELYSTVNEELYTMPYMSERYVHNSINVGIGNGIDDRNYISKTAVHRSTADIYGQSPAKYITGLEPQKPPRSNVSKAARTSKVYSMYAETQEADQNITNKNFNRAKSSDNLLESKQEAVENKRDLVSSQENIVYSNIHDLAMFTENIQRQNQYQSHADMLSNMNYSRVYTGWEKKSANYNTQINPCSNENKYGQMNKNSGESSQNKTDGKTTPAATIFIRNDWSRQAARTKSLEVNEDGHSNVADKTRNGNYEINIVNCCRKRRFDPAHMCTKNCITLSMINNREKEKHTGNSQNSYAYVDDIHSNNAEENKKCRIRNYNNTKLNQSKSLANIILQSDSSSNDTLYQPQNSFNSRSTESTASENSFENCYTTQYIEPLYTSVYNRRRDIFHEEKNNMFSSDIYKATPTSVQPDYSSEKEQNNNSKKPPHMPPPVPPRKMVYQRVLKKFQPVHVNKDDKASRSKSVPPLYRDPPKSTEKNGQKVVALGCSESDTESESYV
ncbi:uncharacterized protein LOC125070087 [Vanessa atalanta]|uniref:uncharacterized protein LOC125070087 n=1 Tax=Vanessa atalanta TaxID=42275 RepID=UPI001FCD8468|nr:uncharacterized protein LOC125070087 [Vanessa atalanta]